MLGCLPHDRHASETAAILEAWSEPTPEKARCKLEALAGILILSPLLLCSALSLWKSEALIYVSLGGGVAAYLWAASRLLPTTRYRSLGWLLPMIAVVGIRGELTQGSQMIFVIWVALIFASVLLAMLTNQVADGLKHSTPRFEVVLATISISALVYSLLVEIAIWVGFFGPGNPASRPYVTIASAIWAIRQGLVLLVILFVLIGASVRVSEKALEKPPDSPFLKMAE